MKAKEKAANNRFKELQNGINKSSPTEAIVQQEKMNEQVQNLTKELDECQKDFSMNKPLLHSCSSL